MGTESFIVGMALFCIAGYLLVRGLIALDWWMIGGYDLERQVRAEIKQFEEEQRRADEYWHGVCARRAKPVDVTVLSIK